MSQAVSTGAVLYRGDLLERMAEFPAGSIDLVFADLPYGATRNAWDQPIDLALFWREVRRVTKPNAAVLCTATQPFATDLINSNRSEFRYDLVWRKTKATGFLNASRMPLRIHEGIYVFYRAQPVYHPQMTEGHPPTHSFKRKKGKHSDSYGAMGEWEVQGGKTTRYPTSVLDFGSVGTTSPEKCRNATQKPTDLVAGAIRTYTDPGAVVLDPCMGSGTTGEACHLTGRYFVGIELRDCEFDLAEARIRRLGVPVIAR